jgi:hypothetical protein
MAGVDKNRNLHNAKRRKITAANRESKAAGL